LIVDAVQTNEFQLIMFLFNS